MMWKEQFDNLVDKMNLKKEQVNEACRLCDYCREDIKQFISDLLKEQQSFLLRKHEETIDYVLK